MLPLAMNTVLPQSMRVKYQLAIGVLPIGLMFSWFIPLFLMVPWLKLRWAFPTILQSATIRTAFYGSLSSCLRSLSE